MKLPPEFEPWAAAALPWLRPPFGLTPFSVGQSNPTYRLSHAGGDVVLRRKPLGMLLPSAHAVEREYRIIAALAGTAVPVPKAFALCEDCEVLGSAFYLMELVTGRQVTCGRMPGASSSERDYVYRGLARTLAALHSVDPASVGLVDFGKRTGYYERQFRRFDAQRGDWNETFASLTALTGRLLEHPAPEYQATIVHGDFRLDNVILGDGPEVAAVLDWELSTLGDPLSDLAYLLMCWVMPARLSPNDSGLADVPLAALGIPTADDMIEEYARCREVQVQNLSWRVAFNLYRLASIYVGIAARASRGNAVGRDAGSYAERVELLAAIALEVLEKRKFDR